MAPFRFPPISSYHFEFQPAQDIAKSLVQHQPTQNTTFDEFSIGQINFKVLYLGGRQMYRRVLRDYPVKSNVEHQPTQNPAASEELCIGQINFKLLDLGGNQNYRRVLRDYPVKVDCQGVKVDAVVYLLDANIFAADWWYRLSKEELHDLLSDESLVDVPFLILGNMIDIPYAGSEIMLGNFIGLEGHTTGKGVVNLDPGVRPLEVFMCSIGQKMGYREGFEWLSQYIK